jgi:hypothetical protein
MLKKTRLKVFPAMLALVACEDSITGVPNPIVEAARAVEAVESVALMVPTGPCVRPGVELISWWMGDGNFLDFQGVNPIATMAGVSFAPGVRDHRRRSNRDHFNVEGMIPLSVLDCFNPETDAVTVSFESLEWVIDPASFVREDDKWKFKGPRREAGVRKFNLRDDGCLKIQARYLNLDLERDRFPGKVSFSISIGPASGDTQIQLDRHGRLRKERPRRFRWRWGS